MLKKVHNTPPPQVYTCTHALTSGSRHQDASPASQQQCMSSSHQRTLTIFCLSSSTLATLNSTWSSLSVATDSHENLFLRVGQRIAGSCSNSRRMTFSHRFYHLIPEPAVIKTHLNCKSLIKTVAVSLCKFCEQKNPSSFQESEAGINTKTQNPSVGKSQQ